MAIRYVNALCYSAVGNALARWGVGCFRLSKIVYVQIFQTGDELTTFRKNNGTKSALDFDEGG